MTATDSLSPYTAHTSPDLDPSMRVLHIYRTYFPDSQGGLEEVIRQTCLNTERYGVESRVFALSENPNPATLERPEATVIRARRHAEIASCSMSATALKPLKQQIAWADVVHYHFPWPFADALHFASRNKKPTVLTYHSDIVRQRLLARLYRPVMQRFLGAMDRIVCTSPNYFATSDVLSQFEQKVDIVPIGISESSYSTPDDEQLEECRNSYGEDFFLFVGVLRYYKGLHILLDAVKHADYRVVIVGSGPTETELKRQARSLGLTNVVFTGYLPDKVKTNLFRLCRGVVFPSYMRAEAFGVTLLEGAMYGKPLISTEVGSGTSHVNINNETGFVVPPRSSRSLRDAMDRLWNQPDLAKLMGKRARERYLALFTGERMGARYHEIYRSLMGKPGSAIPTKSTIVAASRA